MPTVTFNLDLRPEKMWETRHKLDVLEQRLTEVDAVADSVLQKGAKTIARHAAMIAPYKTHFMRNNIVAVDKTVVGRAYYTLYVEKGHRTRGAYNIFDPKKRARGRGWKSSRTGRFIQGYVEGRWFIKGAAEIEMPKIRQELEQKIKVLMRRT